MELREGIVIKTIKYQETSKILYILTSDGLYSCLSRNSLSFKSKNFSYSNSFLVIEFDASKSKKNSFDILTTGKVVDSLVNVQNDYNKMIKVTEIFSMVYEIHDYITDYNNLYYLTREIVRGINESKEEVCDNFYLIIFKLKLLYLMGVGPVFNSCCLCGSNKTIGFSISSGGMICGNHSNNGFLKKEVSKIVEILYLGKIELFNLDIFEKFKDYYNEVNNFVNDYYNYHLPLNTKSNKIINKLKSL